MKYIKIKNPALARKMLWFAGVSFLMSFLAWGVNLAVLAYNIMATDMIWQIALIKFCVAWLVIFTIQRVIMAPIGKHLVLRINEMQLDTLEDISDEITRCVDTTEYLRNKEKNDE